MEEYQAGDSLSIDAESQNSGTCHISINHVKNADLLSKFEYFGVLKMIGLTIVTLTFYIPYWFSKQSKVLNSQKTGTGFSVPAIVFLFLICIFEIGWSVVEGLNDDAKWTTDTGSVISKISRLTLLIAVFSMRKRLHAALEIRDQNTYWMHGFWTFLFGAFYLQYKINQLKQGPNLNTATTQGDNNASNKST